MYQVSYLFGFQLVTLSIPSYNAALATYISLPNSSKPRLWFVKQGEVELIRVV